MSKIWIASTDDFVAALRGLLPRGLIWTREPARRLTLLLEGLSAELARVHGRANDLVTEADPATATAAECLPDWERVAGLPEGPSPPAGVPARRAELLGKLKARGGASALYWEGLATTIGATTPDVYQGPFNHWWTVELPADVTRFRAGSRCGTQLVTFSALAQRIRYFFEKYKPAHSAIFWTGA